MFGTRREEPSQIKHPTIPEPRYRVGPKGVSSGVSFRKLPQPSLDAVRKICEHYEAKCSGTYQSLASRYLFQMGREIRSQIDALENGAYHHGDSPVCEGEKRSRRRQRSEENERYCDSVRYQYNQCCDCPSSTSMDQSCSMSCGSHDGQYPCLASNNDLVDGLKHEIVRLERELAKTKKEAEDAHYSASGKPENRPVAVQEEVDNIKLAYESKLRDAGREIRALKKDARLVIDFVRRKANETLAEMGAGNLSQSSSTAGNGNQHGRSHDDFTLSFRELESRINRAPDNERRVLRKACTKLKNAHEAAIYIAKSEADLGATKDASNTDSISAADPTAENLVLRRRVNDLESWVAALLNAVKDGTKINRCQTDKKH